MGDPAVMVAAPDGTRWVIEARAGELGVGFLVVRTLAGAEVFRELLDDTVDASARVDEVARSIEAGTWRAASVTSLRPRPDAAARWSPAAGFALWLLLLTPLALLAWVAWLAGGVGAAWPTLATIGWAAAGVALARR